MRWLPSLLITFIVIAGSVMLSLSPGSNSFAEFAPYREVLRLTFFALRGGIYPTFSLMLMGWLGLITISLPIFFVVGLRRASSSEARCRAAFWKTRPLRIAATIAIAVGFCAVVIEDWLVRSLLRQTLANAESTLQSSQKESVLADDDAGPPYLRLTRAMSNSSEMPKWLFLGTSIDFHQKVTPEALAEYLAKSQEALIALDEILIRPRLTLTTIQANEVDDEELNPISTAARLLIVRCRHHFSSGLNDRGWSDFLALGAVAKHAGQCASLPMHIARLACWNAQAGLLEALLAEGYIPTDTVSRSLASEPVDASDSFIASIEPSFSGMLAAYCKTRLGIERAPTPSRPYIPTMLSFPTPFLDRLFLARDEIMGTQALMREVAHAAKQPISNQPTSFDELSQVQMKNQMWPFGQKQPFYGRIVNRETPMWTSAAYLTCISSARHLMLRVAVASARFKSRVGRWPTSVQELVPDELPEVPLDPFDQRPLRILLNEGVPRIYSVGLDGVDEGGLNTTNYGISWREDIVIRLGNSEGK